jgi:sulfhydrogenase subunit beta (sulfur reductase)
MKLIDANKLTDLAAALAEAGYRVVAPERQGDEVRLAVWQPGTEIETRAIPSNSAKDFLFPHSEVIARYRLDGGDFQPVEVRPAAPKTVILGVRPCDASAMGVLDAVFNWDYKDAAYNARREATTLVALACAQADEQCFCTSVGGSPDAAAGSDAILRSADGGKRYVLEVATDKGRAMLAAAGKTLAEGEARIDPPAAVPVRFDAKAVSDWLAGNFESPLWRDVALACLGCGACTYACPTCHCFDIQDEATRKESVRLRNWDTCALALFTAHAGGHNPRPTQTERWRQRVMHKFRYFLGRFGRLGCTGCGRCARQCPAGVAMAEVCREIDEARKAVAK